MRKLLRVLHFFWILGVAGFLTAAEIRVHYDTGWGNRIAIRGAAPGLTWQQGVQTTWQNGNVWVLQTRPPGADLSLNRLSTIKCGPSALITVWRTVLM